MQRISDFSQRFSKHMKAEAFGVYDDSERKAS